MADTDRQIVSLLSDILKEQQETNRLLEQVVNGLELVTEEAPDRGRGSLSVFVENMPDEFYTVPSPSSPPV